MLNLSIVEGIVTNRIWTYDRHLHCRLAIYPHNRSSASRTRDTATFITVRFPLSNMPLDIREGMHIRVQGSLGTSDEVLTLKQFLNKLGKEQRDQLAIPPSVVKQSTLVHNHLLIVADTVTMLRRETGKGTSRSRKRKKRSVPTPAAMVAEVAAAEQPAEEAAEQPHTNTTDATVAVATEQPNEDHVS